MFGSGSDGVSLVDVIHNITEENRFHYCESMFSSLTYGWSKLECVRNSRSKYIRSTQPELYDLQADPSESRNLAGAESEAAVMLENRLDSLTFESSGKGANLSEDVDLSAEPRPRPKSLGYVTSGRISKEDASLKDPKEMIRLHILIDEGNKASDEGRYEEVYLAFREVLRMMPDDKVYKSLEGITATVHNRMGIICFRR